MRFDRRRVLQGISATLLLGHKSWSSETKDSSLDVRSMGACGDGSRPDTDSIQRAIGQLSSRDGGTLYFPAGTYLSGSIQMLSHVRLYLDRGAVLKATTDEEAYGVAEPNSNDKYQDFGHSHWKNSLIWGIELESVAIEGGGRIDGSALTADSRMRIGDKAIAFKECRNVLLRDFSMLRCGHFAILATGVDDLTIDNLTIDSNRDGINIDGCRDVRLSNTVVNTPLDDAIVLKSTYALGRLAATEDVTITNCHVTGWDVGTVLDGSYAFHPEERHRRPTGRIKLGTESIGDFRNINISNCTFEHCCGLAVESVDGGTIEGLIVNGMVMRKIQNSPIFLRLGKTGRGIDTAANGALRHVRIENIIATDVAYDYACILSGIPSAFIEDVVLRGLDLEFLGGGSAVEAARTLPELEAGKPEPNMFGVTPSYGFYMRHVRNISVLDSRLKVQREDLRPAIHLQNSENIRLRGISAQGVLTAEKIREVSIQDCDPWVDRKLPFSERLRLQEGTMRK